MKLRAETNGTSYLLEIVPAGVPEAFALHSWQSLLSRAHQQADAPTAPNIPGGVSYTLSSVDDENPAAPRTGTASVIEVMPGVFSVLAGNHSYLIRLSPGREGELDVLVGTGRFSITVGDLRDQAPRKKAASHAGPLELRAQMPGKVVKLLVGAGDSVSAGQGLIIVEAMKMQNEMKSPKDGVVSRICTSEGATVAAGNPLLVIE
jgi:biotin carboxyl carrier protein